MRTYYLHARDGQPLLRRHHRALRGARRRRTACSAAWAAAQIRPGVRIASGELVVGDPAIFREQPAILLRVFADAQRHGVPLSPASRALVRATPHLMDDRVPQRSRRRARLPRRPAAGTHSVDDDAARDARARRARRLPAGVRAPALPGAVRPLPHLHRRRALAARGRAPRAAAARRVQGDARRCSRR